MAAPREAEARDVATPRLAIGHQRGVGLAPRRLPLAKMGEGTALDLGAGATNLVREESMGRVR
jgi:hypothetical protein